MIRGREGTAGVLKPRPCPRVFVLGIVVSVLAHGVLLGVGWWHKPAIEGARAQRMSVRLLSRPAVATPQAGPAPVTTASKTPAPLKTAQLAPRSASRKAARVAPTAQPVPVAAPVAATAAAPAPVEPISGAVFGMPTIAFPGLGTGSRRSAPAPEMPMPPPMLAAQSQAQAMRDAGRAQLITAMQQQAASWPAPSTDGSCALPAQAVLECDNDAIQQAIAPQARVLAGLLDAWRSIEPATERLAIVFAQGRYQLTPIAAIATAALR